MNQIFEKTVGLMRSALPNEYQSLLTNAFWLNERSYYPLIGYGTNPNPQWERPRDALGSLNIPPSNRIYP